MRSYHIRKMVVLQKDEKGFGTYFEIPYTEYRADGSIYSKGTEDFSRERYSQQPTTQAKALKRGLVKALLISLSSTRTTLRQNRQVRQDASQVLTSTDII